MTNFPVLKTPGPLADGAMRITPLGGLGEVGRNMTVFELDDKLLIVDCGVLFPEEDQPGVDLILPDFSSIEEKSGRMRSTPGWSSSGKSTPQSTMSSLSSSSKTVMLRPTSPRPPSGVIRMAPSARGPGVFSTGKFVTRASYRGCLNNRLTRPHPVQIHHGSSAIAG